MAPDPPYCFMVRLVVLTKKSVVMSLTRVCPMACPVKRRNARASMRALKMVDRAQFSEGLMAE